MNGQIERDKRCLDNTNECQYRGRKLGTGDNPTTYECNHKEMTGKIPMECGAEYKDFGQICLVIK
jgi:hypothetical protein